ncbi:MAG: hypothetical protein QOC99_4047, partial [Acidobacteriota bacterium]|nr:hypothetical protein [Acidobacteriota bacterium]
MKLKLNTIAPLIAFILLVGATLGLVPARVAGAHSSVPQERQKVGWDVSEKSRKMAASDDLDVIIQPAGDWTSSLDADLDGKGAFKKSSFKNF